MEYPRQFDYSLPNLGSPPQPCGCISSATGCSRGIHTVGEDYPNLWYVELIGKSPPIRFSWVGLLICAGECRCMPSRSERSAWPDCYSPIGMYNSSRYGSHWRTYGNGHTFYKRVIYPQCQDYNVPFGGKVITVILSLKVSLDLLLGAIIPTAQCHDFRSHQNDIGIHLLDYNHQQESPHYCKQDSFTVTYLVWHSHCSLLKYVDNEYSIYLIDYTTNASKKSTLLERILEGICFIIASSPITAIRPRSHRA